VQPDASGIVRHDPIDIAARAEEAPRFAMNGIVYMKVLFGDDGTGHAASAVMYEIRADGSARIMNDGCEAVIEDGLITGYRDLRAEAAAGAA
jgi:hypothetical protein